MAALEDNIWLLGFLDVFEKALAWCSLSRLVSRDLERGETDRPLSRFPRIRREKTRFPRILQLTFLTFFSGGFNLRVFIVPVYTAAGLSAQEAARWTLLLGLVKFVSTVAAVRSPAHRYRFEFVRFGVLRVGETGVSGFGHDGECSIMTRTVRVV